MIVAPLAVICAALTVAIVFLLFVAPAFAYGPDTWNTSALSELTITETGDENCPAEILIENRQSDYLSELSGALEIGGISVGVTYALNIDEVGAEQYTFFPPDGYIAVPPDVVLPDDQDFTVKICKWVGF